MKNVPFIAEITGLSGLTYTKCSEPTKRRIKFLGFIIFFVAGFSSIIFSLGISIVAFDNLAYMPIITIFWFVIIYLFDRLLISNSSTNSIIALRIVLILILAVIHSLLVDTQIFQSDIKRRYDEGVNLERTLISNNYSIKSDSLEVQITALRKRSNNLNDSLALRLNLLNNEADGSVRGKGSEGVKEIYKAKNINYKRDSTQKALEKAEIKEDIERLKTRQEDLSTQKQFEIALIPQFQNNFFLKNMEEMENIIIEGGVVKKIWAIFWFLLFVIIEALPLLTKRAYIKNIREYFEIEESEMKQNQTWNNIVDTVKIELLVSKQNIELQKEKFSLHGRSKLESMNRFTNHCKDEMGETKSFISEWTAQKKEYLDTYPDIYEKYMKHEMDAQIEDFFKAKEELKIKI